MTQKSSAKNTRFSKSRLAFAIAAQMLTYGNALAGPTGGEVVGGAGSIEQQGTATTITQTSEKMAIDWQSFDVGKDERVNFVQPGQSAVALNRILSNNGSEILGRIDANGHVILVNPHGVVFGEGAVVNAGGLIASGLQINPDDFMNGDLVFKRIEGTDGTVINAGMINAASGGNVALIGTEVENRGLISARLGSVTLASGKEAVLTFDESGLLGVQVDEAILQSELGDKAAITNSGELKAEGGRILLSASTTRDVFSQAVNWGDQKQARSVTYNDDGSFTLGAGGDVVNSGEITVSGETAGNIVALGENIASTGKIRADATQGTGGNIELHSNTTTIISEEGIVTANAEQGGDVKILGKNVGLLDSAGVEAIGENGGGQVLVGGDQEGLNNQIRNADFVYINENASINASATNSGDGGTAIVFAEDTARIHGNLSARGGETEGNGGFVETSGKKGFSITTSPDVSAVNGVAGHWLIDPYDLTVTNGGSGPLSDGIFESGPTRNSTISASLINEALGLGGTVTLRTAGDDGNGGDINIEDSIEFSGNGEAALNLVAHKNIEIKRSIRAIQSPDRKLNVNLSAGGDVVLGREVSIETGGGDFFIGKINSEGQVEAGARNVTFGRDAGINVKGSYSQTELETYFPHAENRFFDGLGPSGRVVINAAGDVKFSNIQVGGREHDGDPAKIDINAGGNIELSQRWQYDNNPTENFSGDPDSYEGKGYTTTRLTASGNILLDEAVVLEYPTEENSAHQDRMHFVLDAGGDVRIGNRGEINTSGGEFVVNDATFLNFLGSVNTTARTGEIGVIKLRKSKGTLELPNINFAGDLVVEAKGDVVQKDRSSLIVRGKTSFRLTGGNLTIDKQDNVFGDSVWVEDAGDVYLVTGGDLVFGGGNGEMNVTGKLDVSARNIEQTRAIKLDGKAIFSAEEDVTLKDPENLFVSLAINKAQTVEIVNSQGLQLAGVQVADKLEISVTGDVTQTSDVNVNRLVLDVSGNTSLELGGNGVSELSGFIGGSAIIKTPRVNVKNELALGAAASLTLSDVESFTLSGQLKGSGANSVVINGGEKRGAYTVSRDASWEQVKLEFNGAGGSEDTLNIEKAGSITVWLSDGAISNELLERSLTALNIETIDAKNGESNTLIGASSSTNGYEWTINGRNEGTVRDFGGNQQVKFINFDELVGGKNADHFRINNGASIKEIRGGDGEDTLDYSNWSGALTATLGEESFNIAAEGQDRFSQIEDIEILVGNGASATLQAASAANTWHIGGAENNIIKSEFSSLVDNEVPVDGELPVDERPLARQMKFRDFGTLKGGTGADTFLVNLDGKASQYTLDGGAGVGIDVLEFVAGGEGWQGTYEIKNGNPYFSFTPPTKASVEFTYFDIESIALNANLDLMTLAGSSGSDTFFLGPQYWQWNTSPKIAFSQLQGLRVEADSSDTIDLTGTINLPESLVLQGGRLRINENTRLEADRLILAGIDDVVYSDGPLKFSVNSLTLKDNETALDLLAEDGVELAGLTGERPVLLTVLQGDLTQSHVGGAGPIQSTGPLGFVTDAGVIRLDRRDNEISGSVTLITNTEATLYANSNLVLDYVDAPYLNLETTGSISSTDTGVVAGVARLISDGDIKLNSTANDISRLTVNASGDVELMDVASIVLYDSKIDGDLKLQSDRIVFNGNVAVKEDASLVASEILFEGFTNIGRGLDLKAQKLTFAGETTSTTFNTNAETVFVQGLVIIIADYEFGDAIIFGAGIHTMDGEIQTKSKFTGLERMIEVESLADIDPAIFTNVKNYFYQDISIQLPSDQLYEQPTEGKPLARAENF
jgi:filamentous haemagglutinin family N-terminal domain